MASMASDARGVGPSCIAALTLAAFLTLGAQAAQAQAWSTRAPILEAIQEVAVAELDGRVYLVGGLTGFDVSDRVEVWDPGSDSWSFAAPLPIPLHHTTATAVAGRLYVIGGWSDLFATPLAHVFVYDPGADSWSEKTAMPTARGSPAATALAGKIYVTGGDPGDTDFAVYDPVTDSWQTLPPMPTGRQHLGAAAAGGLVYAVGGRESLGAGEDNVDAVEAYDPQTGSWSALAALPLARSGLAVAAVPPYVLAFGGEGNAADPDGVFADADAFDTRTGVWTPLSDMPTPRHGIGAAVLAGRVHIPGGAPAEGLAQSDVHEVYNPSTELAFHAVPALGFWPAAGVVALLAALVSRRPRAPAPPRARGRR
jgi:N-acetylneuraminic acid mutarotase